MPKHGLRILQVNHRDIGGGAEKICMDLHNKYRALGLDAWLAVGTKLGSDPFTYQIDNDGRRSSWARASIKAASSLSPLVNKVRGAGTLQKFVKQDLAEPLRWWKIRRGREDFDYPATSSIPNEAPVRADILHVHNLHGGYFDLRALPVLSNRLPTLVTLHDSWLFSGHCAHAFDCERWQIGCGDCPDLAIYPAIRRDATNANWLRKQEIYSRSRVFLATPSRWLMERLERSILLPAAIDRRVIPNGVDGAIFHPKDKLSVRAELGLPPEKHIVLLTATRYNRSSWNDFKTVSKTLDLLAQDLGADSPLFLVLGAQAPAEHIGQLELRFIPFQTDQSQVARYFQAANIYLHITRADNFPTAILEAQACGTPVIATAVGGIPEQVKNLNTPFAVHGIHNQKTATAILTHPGDFQALAKSIEMLLQEAQLRASLGDNAAEHVQTNYLVGHMVDHYLEWYTDIQHAWNKMTFKKLRVEI